MRNKKGAVAVCLAFVISALSILEGTNVQAYDEKSTFDMSESGAAAEEDWSRLRLDMKWAETQEGYGYWGTPLGNGLFGVKENGGVQEDVFVLNHSTFWSGDPAYRDYLYEGKGGYKNSVEQRAAGYQELINTLKNAYSEGISKTQRNELMKSLGGITTKMWESDEQSAFLSAGRMRLKFPELANTTDYKRILDMDKAMSEVSFKKDGVGYVRESFISSPDNVMVTRITNEKKQFMNMEVNLELHPNMVGKSDDNKVFVDEAKNEVVMTGRAPYNFKAADKWDENRGILMEARTKVILPEGGEIKSTGSSLKVSGAEEIILLYTCETSYKDVVTDPSNSGVNYSEKVRATLDSAANKTYDTLLETHLDEYRSLFRRFWISMEGNDILAADGRTGVSPWEYAMHYQYARYLNIACERSNSPLPQGLFGLWSTEWVGINEGAYFLNENLQKKQELKGAANLADSSDGQYNFINSWTQESTGQRTAQNIYGAEDGAWMMSHSTGLWAKSGMWGTQVEWGSWLTGGIWALDSLFDKYNYTQDIELLKKYYPLLEGAAKFALSTLIEVDGVDGELKGYKVVAPAGSPEHWYWVGDTKVGFDVASACDTLLYYNLFHMIEKGAEDLGRAGVSYDEELVNRVLEARDQMMPLEMFINKETGRLKEWYNEYPVGQENHRHASHLIGLFLSNIAINQDDTPELYEAQKKEMYRWMMADGGNLPDRTLMAVRSGYAEYGFSRLKIVGTDYGHDGVMQWTPYASSIPEAVVDSRFDQINLMENLPSAWSSGTIKGIRARGGYQMSIKWENGELVHCVIDSPAGETPRVLYKGKPVVLSTDERFTVNRASSDAQQLEYEVQDKLDGKYTQESKAALQAAFESNNYDEISAALLNMEPVNYIQRDVAIEAEEGINVLMERGQTLQLKAESDKEDAKYLWTIENLEGGSAEKIATVDENGVVTAIGGGKVTVTAAIDGETRSKGMINLMIETGTAEIKESIDDRDHKIKYSSGWRTWEESKHRNGTITYSQNAGAAATFYFTGTGFDFIGSSAPHIGNFKVILDDEVIAENVRPKDKGYNLVVYSKLGLEDKEHKVTIEGLGNRLDIDAMDIYADIPASTNRKELITEYKKCLEIVGENRGTEELIAGMEQAIAVINNFDVAQTDIDNAGNRLKELREGIDEGKTVSKHLQLAIDMAEKLEQSQEAEGCFIVESWIPVKEALDSARAVMQNPQISQEEADTAFLNLITRCSLLESGVHRLGLKAAIEGTEEILLNADMIEQYTPESVDSVRTVLAEAKKVYAEESADQETINSATRKLMDAVTSLLIEEENTRLDILIQKAEELLKNKGQYTVNSIENLEKVLIMAKNTAENMQATPEEINRTYNSLAEAIAGLVRKAEKSELKNALDKACEILNMADVYVKDTITELQTVTDEAQAMYNKEDATPSQVGEAIKRLVKEILKARLIGDVNMDGTVNSEDASHVLKYAAEYIELSEDQLQAADVNADRISDSSDAAKILQYTAEIILSFQQTR